MNTARSCPNRLRKVAQIAFAVCTLVALGYTPAQSGAVLRNTAACELSAPLELWWLGLNNPRHIVSYSILCVIAATSASTHRLSKAVVSTLVISVLVELEQACLLAGHCRVRDLLPNAVAVCPAAFAFRVVQAWRVRAARATRGQTRERPTL